MPRRTALLVGVTLMVVLAGCQAPDTDRTPGPPTTGASPSSTATGTPSSGTTGTPGPAGIAVRNGSLPVDPDRVFRRMQAVLGTNATPPAYVEIVHDPDALVPGGGGELPRSWRVLGLRAGGLNESRVERLENGVTTGLGGIRLYVPGNTSAATVEWLLAHEFVHYVYVQQGVGRPLARALPETTDARVFVARALGEGAAVYATNAYIDSYGLETPPNSRLYTDLRPAIADGSVGQYVNDAYITGYRYVAGRAANPSTVPELYGDPPTTSEQVIHGYVPGAEPPAPLGVRARDGDRWRAVGRDTLGEAFVRTVLDGTLPRRRALRAAAGWGNDSLVVFRTPDRANASYAWVLRWDDATNATEFRAAYEAHLADRGRRVETETRTGTDRWAVDGVTVAIRRPAARTVVIVAGARAFVEGVAVTVENGVVAVEPP